MCRTRGAEDYTRKNAQLATSLQTSCNKFVNKLSTSCLRTAPKLLQQVWNKQLTTCNKLVGIIRLVTRLFQQVRYNNDITSLLQD